MSNDLLLLMVYSNPDDTGRLRLDKERRSLIGAFERSAFPKSQYEILEAATVDSVLRSLADKPYSLLHFSGHGEKNGILVESGDDLTVELVAVERIETVLQAATPHLKIAVFLSCFSSEFANKLIAHVPYILATVGEAGDVSCTEFVDCFYERLLKGDDIDTAYLHAVRRTPELEMVLLRRAEVEGRCRALVHGYQYGCSKRYYVDISAIEEEVARLGMSCDELVSMMARKIRYHGFAFRYPRSNAILSIGEIFGSFSWQDSEDSIACTALHRLRDDAPEDLAESFMGLLLSYNEHYVAEYRSPAARLHIRYDQVVAVALKELVGSYRCYFDYRPMDSGVRPDSHSLDPRSRHAAVFARECSSVYRVARATGCAHMTKAEEALAVNNISATIAHLEAALSSLHDLMNAGAKRVLD